MGAGPSCGSLNWQIRTLDLAISNQGWEGEGRKEKEKIVGKGKEKP